MNKDKIKISKIEIKIGNQTISLTPDELKELKDVLDNTFPKEEVIKWLPSQPIFVSPPHQHSFDTVPPWEFLKITCDAGNTSYSMCLKLNDVT